eukprot:TRINITY_DN8268_c0_g1_i1.p1 TRINITY_DN8268_c0_g1~~TRINITY_DN8268_c0_g1_i1.p1  ORF type:complete len:544 (-),score=105.68 TRINITY_DN8268_c0_g1_i1:546-2177(-)
MVFTCKMATAQCMTLWTRPSIPKGDCPWPSRLSAPQKPSETEAEAGRPRPLLRGLSLRSILLRKAPPAAVTLALQDLAPEVQQALPKLQRTVSAAPPKRNLEASLPNAAEKSARRRSASAPGTRFEMTEAALRPRSSRRPECGDIKSFKSVQEDSTAQSLIQALMNSEISCNRSSARALKQKKVKSVRRSCQRPKRVRVALLSSRAPTADELSAADAVRTFWTGQCEAEAEEEDDESAVDRRFQELRHAFLKEHRAVINAAELGALEEAPVAHGVKARFLAALEEIGKDTLVLGYHGTPERNLPSIFQRGLLVPRKSSEIKVANGSAHGVGIYLAESNAHSLSRGFLRGSTKMLICGVVDSTLSKSTHDGEEDGTKQNRFVYRGGGLAHRAHRKPAQQLAKLHKQRQEKQHAKLRSTYPFSWIRRCHYLADDGRVRHAGNAMIVFKEEQVAPLFVASPQIEESEYDCRDPKAPNLENSNSPFYEFLAMRRCWDGERNVWMPKLPCSWDPHAAFVRRRLTQRERHLERQALRTEKVMSRSVGGD